MARKATGANRAGVGQALAFVEAILFERAFGVRAETLMLIQPAYALAEARAREDEIVVAAA